MNLSTIVKLLDEECRTRISIERVHEAFSECGDLKLTPDQPLHHSAYCRERKLTDDNNQCALNKKKSLEIARLGRSFCGKCPFGVKEYVKPVIVRKELAAVCYFTILPETVPLAEIRKKAEFLAEFITIAIQGHQMQHPPKRNSAEYYRKQCLHFLDLHYMENIAETDLAGHLGLNCTYFSSLFRRIMGKTFREALTERRIHEAKIYLKLHRKLSISYIARLCGFSDSNYFSLVFHRQVGLSPKNYRSCIEIRHTAIMGHSNNKALFLSQQGK